MYVGLFGFTRKVFIGNNISIFSSSWASAAAGTKLHHFTKSEICAIKYTVDIYIIYSPSRRFKYEWLSFFHGTQKWSCAIFHVFLSQRIVFNSPKLNQIYILMLQVSMYANGNEIWEIQQRERFSVNKSWNKSWRYDGIYHVMCQLVEISFILQFICSTFLKN